MPRVKSTRTKLHQPAAGPGAENVAKRRFVNTGNADVDMERVDIGSGEQVPANELLSSFSTFPSLAPQPATQPASEPGTDTNTAKTKKSGRAARRDALLQKIQAQTSPYSKSHARRVKRKAKNSLSVDLENVGKVLDEVKEAEIDVEDGDAQGGKVSGSGGNGAGQSVKRIGKESGKAGGGLNTSKRKKMLEMERKRLPAIMSHPSFAANPFATIRQHAQNTLVPLKKQ